MKRLLARLEYTARRAGLAGAVGAALLAFVPGYYLSVVRPLEARAELLRREIDARATDASGRDSHLEADRSRQERIAAFRGFFPPPAELPAWLARINGAAEAERLQLLRGEYRRVGEVAEQPHRIQVTFPVKGNYRQIRRFIAGALASVPILALDEVVFQRSSANDPLIEAQIRFTLFVGDAV